MLTTSFQEKTRLKHLLRAMTHHQGVAAATSAATPEAQVSVDLHSEEAVNVVDLYSEEVGHQLNAVVAILLVLVVAAAGLLLLKIVTSGYTLSSIFANMNFYLHVSSFFRKSDAKKTLKHFPTSTIAQLPRRAPYT